MSCNKEQVELGGDYAGVRRSLGEVQEHLKTLHVKIQSIQKQFGSFPALGEQFDALKAEGHVTRRKCASLEKVVRVLSEKIENNVTVEAMFQGLIQTNKELEHERQILEGQMFDKIDELDSIDAINAEHEAALRGRRELEAQIKEVRSSIQFYSAAEEMLDALRSDTEETIRVNGGLEEELEYLKQRKEQLQDRFQVSKAEIETVLQKNQALQQEVDDLYMELENESMVQFEMDEMNQSKYEERSQTEDLQEEIFELSKRLLGFEDLQVSYKIAKEEKELISQQIQLLQQKKVELCQELENEDTIRESYNAMVTEKAAMSLEHVSLREEALQLKERHLRFMELEDSYKEAKAEREDVKRKNEALMNKIQGLSNEVHKEKHLMIKYEALKASNETLGCDSAAMAKDLVDLNLQIGVLRKGRSQNKTLQEKMNDLQSMCDEPLRERNTAVQNPNGDQDRMNSLNVNNVTVHNDFLEHMTTFGEKRAQQAKNTADQNPNGDLGQRVQEDQDRMNGLNVKIVTVDNDFLEHMKTVQENRAQQARR
ncbi:hypothetical protein CgunFtcFv8_008004 [Champsocephalus gunnari]|uniref:Uncharacterized protein n=2 Tax=Champsocephalus gunnari TaxID=52237 RepID=A0AAN8CZE4_CHAGU|nr:hypothetical protein CgunFtcFv8_008004 [Champsocephalus gunnari]